MAAIDLNSDVGESFGRWSLGDDLAMFGSVSSANVACGFHAGDPSVIRRTCREAAGAGVVIGAHVGYRDLAGFGRRFMDISPTELADDVVYQIGALQALAAVAGTQVRYVKPHGGLYNAIVTHTAQAQAVVDAVKSVDPNLPILGLPGSEVLRLAEAAGLRAVTEAFADRAYNPDGTLVSRSLPGAVLEDPEQVAEHVLRMATESSVRAIDGSTLKIRAESICVHGDSPGAVAMATAVKSALGDAGVSISSFL
ncbi:LamB/YcsF family protein [Pseudarthrobacter cellobiosi]|uniref:LamB/YcsF family protein n=1 Tax=Pseudarthrobacter cellobiosi TaxID=2953654 RepID=UPI00208DEB30|nr:MULTISPECIES: 5-oxoprolinase subunit PxpA [unclassified Pseudarthrobacter]MCO4255164.1 LamB/YcsF family protein [Pseudarthrobacter sp. HLT1-5]MCO4275131.1 LamB/YcsF family protein [Pseudarthrobacter sp. HLT3-5]